MIFLKTQTFHCSAFCFEYLKWLKFCSVNKNRERKLRTNCAIVFVTFFVVLLLYPVLTIKQSCSPWIAHKDVDIYWTEIYMFLFHMKLMWLKKKRYGSNWALHSLSCSIHHTFLYNLNCLTTEQLILNLSDSIDHFFMTIKIHYFQDFSLDYTGKGVTGTIFDLELTSDASVHVLWEVTETLGHYFTRKHLFSGLSTSYTQVKAVIYFCLYFSHFK